MSTQTGHSLWPLVLYFFLAIATAMGMIGVSFFLGQRHRERETGQPYESGIVATGTARIRFDVKFYMVAMFFVVFDLESLFIFSWAVAVREAGWAGYIEVLIFIAVLAAALVYLWRMGALDWASGKTAKER